MRLQGKQPIITGATSGMGKSYAVRFCQRRRFHHLDGRDDFV